MSAILDYFCTPWLCFLGFLCVGLVACYCIIGIYKKGELKMTVSFMRKIRENKLWLAVNYVFIFVVCLTGYIASIRSESSLTEMRSVGKGLYSAFLFAVSETASLLGLNFSLSGEAGMRLQQLMAQYPFYNLLINACFLLSFLTAIAIVIALIGRAFLNSIAAFCWNRRKKRVLILGNQEMNYAIYTELEKMGKHTVICVSKANERSRAAQDTMTVITADLYSAIDTQIRRLRNGHRLELIINSGTDTEDILLAKYARNRFWDTWHIDRLKADVDYCIAQSDWEGQLKAEKQIVTCLDMLHITIFGKPEYESVYRELQDDSMGTLTCVDKYREAAAEFVSCYPFTEFLDAQSAEKILSCDYDKDGNQRFNGCVRPNVRLQMLLVGFGDTNRSILEASIETNQFVQDNPGGIPQPLNVHYHIFNKSSMDSRVLNNNCFRYKNEFFDASGNCIADPDEYLPLPQYPAEIQFSQVSIDSPEFLKHVQSICTSGENTVSYVVVAVGSDLENIDFAQKLYAASREWDLFNFHIFVKVRKQSSPAGKCASDILLLPAHDTMHSFGSEDIRDLCHRIFENEQSAVLAQARNRVYILAESQTAHEQCKLEDSLVHASYDWYRMSPEKRSSNIAAITALRMKLQLIGLDYKKAAQGALKSNAEYFARYVYKYPPKKDMERSTKDLEVYDYTKCMEKAVFTQGDPRLNLIVQEHYRWNAYMIGTGFIPASEEQMKVSIKSYALRYHGNLTTFEGLFNFRALCVKHGLKSTEQDADVIKYDAQLMDEAWWFLTKSGYQIYERGWLNNVTKQLDNVVKTKK